MPDGAFPDSILVAMDFSPSAMRAFDLVLAWRRRETDVTLLHIVDAELARSVEQLGLSTFDEAMRTLRERAEREFAILFSGRETAGVEKMVVEGIPFVEIVKVANDLDCGLIVVGSRGTGGALEKVLFGSTAERVLRAATRPVLCVP
ncbi:MAG: hypothetical protein KatS3mg076_3148 [Candidatus Binatia bacterium]|nr:MAG: hypothetical protein KatS3mg076_3148 [Candidatus Binatia bacterium]